MATRRKPAGGQQVALAWLASRAFIFVSLLVIGAQNARTLTELIRNWDVLHFYQIAGQGYATDTDAAFFPGLPALLYGFSRLGIPYEATGVLVSLLGSAASAWALYRIGERRFPGAGTWAAIAWLIAPMAIFTVVPYTESLFCGLAFWAWERMTQKRWSAMGILAALACTVRVSGLFLWGALIVAIIIDQRRAKDRAKAIIPLLLPIATLVGYVYYHYTRSGDWLAWYHAQTTGWQRGFAWPWQSFLNTLPPIQGTDWRWIFIGEVTSMAVGLLAVIVLLVKKRVGEASWIAVQVLAFSLSYWWMSVNRAVLLWFPLWLLFGEAAAHAVADPRKRSTRSMLIALALASLVIQLVWTGQFAMGKWAS